MFWRADYDEFRQGFDDTIKVDNSAPLNHYCVMYDDNIPPDIFYAGAECQYFISKDEKP